jgi:hypothetical protein
MFQVQIKKKNLEQLFKGYVVSPSIYQELLYIWIHEKSSILQVQIYLK